MDTQLDQISSQHVLRSLRFQVRNSGLSPTALEATCLNLASLVKQPKSRIAKDPRSASFSGQIDAHQLHTLRHSAAVPIAGLALIPLHANSNLPVIGTLPDHFAESVTLARNSQHSEHQASESQFRATWMLQLAAGVAICNTYNRNPPVKELRKGLFFRGRRRGAGIDSMSESFRTAFQTIYDLTGNQTANHGHMASIQISDNPRHAPSVQC